MADDASSLVKLGFDYRNPDYIKVFQERVETIRELRKDPRAIEAAQLWYREHPADLINDWGVTFDPRNSDDERFPTTVPFLLFPRQREWCDWVLERWQAKEPGLTEKSRDMGISWLAVGLSVALCSQRPGINIGFGSRKAEYVDKIGFPKALFYKARKFIECLPVEFRGGCDVTKNAPYMLISFPETGSTMTGESGDSIGRGDRASLYFVDEAAHLEHPDATDAALSQTTNSQQDMSSVYGTANAFAQKKMRYPARQVFTFHWRSDPRKDDAWYQKQKEELSATIVAQEIDINYNASVEGVLIPNEWVQAAVDADVKLGLAVTGSKVGALDVADEGIDLNAFCEREGIRVNDVTAWSGVGSDIMGTVEKAFLMADDAGISEWYYDADGLGAGVRGDARVVNDRREQQQLWRHDVQAFRGSGEVFRPERSIPQASPDVDPDRKARKNKDFFANSKAQGWWELRVRFQRTFRAVKAVERGEPNPYPVDDLIVLRGSMPAIGQVTMELSQPTFTQNTAGKIIVDKAPDNTRSPNHGDAIMIAFAPKRGGWVDAL